MPRHDVDMSIPTSKVVLHADVVFEVRSDGEKLGELRVSQGGVDWRPGNAPDRGQAALGAVRQVDERTPPVAQIARRA